MPAELYSYKGSDVGLEVKRLFGDTGNVQITDAHLLRWINNGQRSIAATNPFLEKLFTTNLLTGQSSYDLNALMGTLRVQSYASVVANGRKLTHVTYQQFLSADLGDDLDNSAEGSTMFTEYADQLILLPAPNETVVNGLVIAFIAWPADLTQIGDDLTVPDRFYNALVQYVFAQALALDENFEASAGQLDQHAAALAVEKGREDLNPDGYYPVQTYVEP